MSPKQIRNIREHLQVTQRELAEVLGLTQKTVSQYEIGFRDPGATVQIILMVLEVLPRGEARQLLQRLRNASKSLKTKRRTVRR